MSSSDDTSNKIARRRGLSIAAAALSIVLVAPFSGLSEAATPTAHAAPNGTASNSTAPAENAQEAQNRANSHDVIDADAIASGRINGLLDLDVAAGAGRDVVSGRANIITPLPGGDLTSGYSGYEPTPNGVPVYLQWIDIDGAVSPIYKADTHELRGAGKGAYAFHVTPWTDENGKEHSFRTSIRQQLRIWVEPTENPKTGNQLVPLRVAPGYAPYVFAKGSGEGSGEVPLSVGTNGNMTKTGVWMYEVPGDYMKASGNKLIEDPQGPIKNPATHYDKNNRRTVSGDVWLESGNERQVLTGSSAYGDDPAVGYTVYASSITPEGIKAYNNAVGSLEPHERAEATKKFIEANPQYLAGTVYGKTNEQGKYTLRFPDSLFKHEYSATTRDSFQNNLYMWVEDPEGHVIPGYSSFTQPVFQSPNYNAKWASTELPAYNNAALGVRYSRLHNVNFGLLTFHRNELTITNQDAEQPDGFAQPGDTVNLSVSGNLSPLNNTVKWVDADGNVIKSCTITSITDLGDCGQFTIPDDAQPGAVYDAVLETGEKTIAADSVTVDAGEEGLASVKNEPIYEESIGAPGEKLIIPSPVFDDATTDVIEKHPAPEGTTFTLPGAQGVAFEGTPKKPLTKDQVAVHDDGSVEVTPGSDITPGIYHVPVTVTYPDDTVDYVFATVKIPGDNPAWGTGIVAPGKEVSLSNQGGEVPEGTTTETVGPGSAELADDGSLIVTPNDDAQPGDEVTVLVKDSDGAVLDQVTVTVDGSNDESSGDDAGENSEAPSWNNESVRPDGEVTIDNTGGVVPEDTTVDTDGPGTAELADDGSLTVTPNEDAKPGDTITATVKDKDGNVLDTVTVTVEKSDDTTDPAEKPAWDDAVSEEGEPTPIKNAGGPVPDGVEVSVDGPASAHVDNDGTLVVIPKQSAKPGDKAVVTVKDEDGNVIDTATVTINGTGDLDHTLAAWDNDEVQPGGSVTLKNTGGPVADGTTVQVDGPGTAERDDDGSILVTPNEDAQPGDVITVTVEDKDGSVVDTVTVTVDEPDVEQPAWNDGSVKPGEDVSIPNTGGEVAHGTSVDVEGPGKAEIAEDGSLTVTPSEDAKPGDTITATVKDKGGNVLDTVIVTVAPGDAPAWADGSSDGGDPVTIPNTGGPVPDGAEVSVAGPATALIEDDGTLVVIPGDSAKSGDVITVTVKDKDGNVLDTVTITVEKSDDTTDPAVKPAWDDSSVKPGESASIPNTGGEVADGTTVDVDGPGKAEIADDGSLTVTPNEDAKPGDTITATVKDKDGNVLDIVTITVDKSDDTTDPANKPAWDDSTVDPSNGPAIIPNTGGKVPADVEVSVDGAGEAAIDSDGNLIVAPTRDAKPGDTITVTVKDKDGNVIDTATVIVEGDDSGSGDGSTTANPPLWGGDVAQPGQGVSIPNGGGNVPEGTTLEVEGPGKATIDKDGKLVVTPNNDAKPGDVITVTVKDKDGNVVDTVTVTVGQNAADKPAWNDGSVKPGEDVSIPNTGGEVADGTSVDVEGPGKAEIAEDGSLTVTPNEDAEPGDVITVTVKDKDGNVLDTVTVTVAPGDAPAWADGSSDGGDPVTIPNTGGPVPDGAEVSVAGPATALIEDDGTLVVIPGDSAKSGDVITVTVKDKDGNVLDTVSVTVEKSDDTTDPAEKPAWDDASAKPGEGVSIPNTGGAVADGTTVDVDGPGEATIDKDGNVVVTPNEDAKPGDVITVTVKDKDGNVLDTVTVTVEKPDTDGNTSTDDVPDWNSGNVKPGGTVTIPNKGGKVPEGTKPEVQGPGDATIDKDGNVVVTPNKDAKPGDVITVTVKDKDGNVIDTVIVKIDDDQNAGSGDNGSGDDGSGDNGSGDNGSGDNGSGDNGSGNGDSGNGDSGNGGHDGGSLPPVIVVPGGSTDIDLPGNSGNGGSDNTGTDNTSSGNGQSDGHVIVNGPGTVTDKGDHVTVTPTDDARLGDTIIVKRVDGDGNVIGTQEVTVADKGSGASQSQANQGQNTQPQGSRGQGSQGQDTQGQGSVNQDGNAAENNSGRGLANTGANVAVLSLVAAGLVAVGAWLIGTRRRKE